MSKLALISYPAVVLSHQHEKELVILLQGIVRSVVYELIFFSVHAHQFLEWMQHWKKLLWRLIACVIWSFSHGSCITCVPFTYSLAVDFEVVSLLFVDIRDLLPKSLVVPQVGQGRDVLPLLALHNKRLGGMHYDSKIRMLSFGNIQIVYWRLFVELLFQFSVSLC